MIDEDFIKYILQTNNLSITIARTTVIRFLSERKQAFTSLNEFLKGMPAHISRTTLYRTLLSFCDIDMLYKVADNKNKVFYGIGDQLKKDIDIGELTGRSNYHFQCTLCERISCLPVVMQDVQLPNGFTKTNSHLLLLGVCNHCAAKQKKPFKP